MVITEVCQVCDHPFEVMRLLAPHAQLKKVYEVNQVVRAMATISNPGSLINALLLVAKMHQNALNTILKFKKFPALETQ